MRVGSYELVERIGVRGVISTHSGARLGDGLPVTISVLAQRHLSDDLLRRRMKREFASAKSVDSHHVVKYLDLVETDQVVAAVTERLPARNLRAHMTLASELPFEQALGIARQVAHGLYACHRAGVVHRNVTPENIYLRDDGTVTLANFGLASMHTATTLTMTGTMIGDPEYAPPENLFSAPRDIRGDIYSLGIILWEMLTGHNPFEGGTLTEIIQRKQDDGLPAPSSMNPDVPPWLDILIGDMMAADPDRRPASLHQVIIALATRSHLHTADHDSADHCLACGYPLPAVEDLWFCPFCGRSASTNDDEIERSVLLITSVQDVGATASFLEQAFSEKPKQEVAKTLAKMPVPVVEDIQADENSWLAESLRKRGCSTEVLPLSAQYYKLSALILFCALQIVLVTVYIRPSDLTPNMPDFYVGLFWSLKLMIAGGIAGVMHRYIGFHYAPAVRIPVSFMRGAFRVEPFSKHLPSALGVASSWVVVGITAAVFFVGSYLVLWFARNLINVNIARILPTGGGSWLVGSPEFHHPADYGPFYGPAFSSLVLAVGALLILKIVIGRVHAPPLFSAMNARDGGRDVHERSDFAVLERLNSQISEIQSKDFRYIISSIIDQYARISRSLASNDLQGSLRHELSETLFFAIRAVSAIGDQARGAAADASEAAVTRADRNYLRLKAEVSQSSGQASDLLKEELREAQARVLHHETATEMLAHQLNRLRLISGGLQAAAVQVLPEARHAGASETRQGLEMLGDVLSSLTAETRPPHGESRSWQ